MKNNSGNNFERKFSKYAIPNLSLYLIICYAIGYVISMVSPALKYLLTLDPGLILQGADMASFYMDIDSTEYVKSVFRSDHALCLL